MGKATIQDVARRAGVSIKTVSRVINREANVRDATRTKVERAVAKLHYTPNQSARSLAGTRSYLVGLFYDNPSASYLINIQNGVLSTSRAEGYDLVIEPCHYNDPTLVDSISSMIRTKSVDGLILTPPLSDMADLVKALDKVGVSQVLIAPADESNAYRSVFTNDREACSEMTQYLASLGHRRIAFLRGHPDHRAVGNRYLGYRDGLKTCRIRFDRKLVRQGDNSFESGERTTQRLLELDEPPTAIFAANDDMAAAAMRVAHEMGYEIPDDLSIAGFDDVPLASRLWPSLTTIHQPMEEMAVRATALLLRQLRDEEGNGLAHTIPSRLVIRESTGPAPKSRR